MGSLPSRRPDALVTSLGIPAGEELFHLRYRGQGWPGRFTAVSADGREVSAGYDESWDYTGPTTQWRCKICPDGVGESSDLAAGDLWRVDDRGYPDFTEGDGISVLIARTARGRDVVERAVAAGVLKVRPVDLRDVVGAQPLQVSRRTTLLARLLGARAAGRPVPRYRGFRLFSLACACPGRRCAPRVERSPAAVSGAGTPPRPRSRRVTRRREALALAAARRSR